jgi:hypothetical protein
LLPLLSSVELIFQAAKNQVHSFSEISSCNYEMVVLTNRLCAHPSFQKPPTKEHEVGTILGECVRVFAMVFYLDPLLRRRSGTAASKAEDHVGRGEGEHQSILSGVQSAQGIQSGFID